MPRDTNQFRASDMTAPAEDGELMVNNTQLSFPTRAIYIGTAGNVEVVFKSGRTLMFKNVPAGATLPLQITKITNNTTATDVNALF